jgi:hypothetical protein
MNYVKLFLTILLVTIHTGCSPKSTLKTPPIKGLDKTIVALYVPHVGSSITTNGLSETLTQEYSAGTGTFIAPHTIVSNCGLFKHAYDVNGIMGLGSDIQVTAQHVNTDDKRRVALMFTEQPGVAIEFSTEIPKVGTQLKAIGFKYEWVGSRLAQAEWRVDAVSVSCDQMLFDPGPNFTSGNEDNYFCVKMNSVDGTAGMALLDRDNRFVGIIDQAFDKNQVAVVGLRTIKNYSLGQVF